MPQFQATPLTPAIAAPLPASTPLEAPLVLLLASGAGLAAASLYYSQPMLGLLSAQFHASGESVGLIPTLTQFGYALGLFFLAPLGDRYDRRRIILLKAAVLCLALLLTAAARSIGGLAMASLVIGLAATMAQDIVPAAATLAPEARRGKVVGTVMTGLLLGILLSRVISGLVAQRWGWRVMFVAAAASIALIGVAAWRRLPRFEVTTRLSYGALLRSLASLWMRHRALRRASTAQGLLSVSFSAFWSTLAVMLHARPFHMGAAVAGAFGLAGAAGALAAPIAGRLADRRGPGIVTRFGAALVVLAFAAMSLGSLLDVGAQLWVLVISTIVFDLGIQSSLIAHQHIVYSIDAGARSRLNAVLMTAMFIGMAVGSAIGALLFAQWGWIAVTLLATMSALGALALRVWPRGV